LENLDAQSPIAFGIFDTTNPSDPVFSQLDSDLRDTVAQYTLPPEPTGIRNIVRCFVEAYADEPYKVLRDTKFNLPEEVRRHLTTDEEEINACVLSTC
jgi:hypothetical protein